MLSTLQAWLKEYRSAHGDCIVSPARSPFGDPRLGKSLSVRQVRKLLGKDVQLIRLDMTDSASRISRSLNIMRSVAPKSVVFKI